MARSGKLEIRVSDDEQEVIQRAAKQAGYGPRGFSEWARRVLMGLTYHPEQSNAKAEKAKGKNKTA